MAENKTYFDSDDIRVRGDIDMHPQFYWRVVYNHAKDNFIIYPFMRINNSDSGRADWMEVQVTTAHEIRYRKAWEEFIAHNKLNRYEYTREEMMQVVPFRDKLEYNRKIILLPETHPEYWALVSDFSLRLNGADIDKLNSLDGIETPKPEPKKDKDDVILDAIKVLADQIKTLNNRVTEIENK